jgi:adenosylcobinamide-GDP ribazoletransferase
MRGASAALAFLTRVPVGRAVAFDGADVARGVWAFPLVGALVGGGAGGVVVLAHLALSPLVAAALGVAFAVAVTGAFHIDALADTCDALGAHTRERALEIMRDSRIGSFGAAAVALDLLVKTAAVAELAGDDRALVALVAAGALSRAASPPLAALLPYARAERGPGGRVTRVGATTAAVIGVAIAIGALGLDGAIVAGAVAAATVALGAFFVHRFGGVTGDTLGAATEVGETLALVVAAALV